MADTHNRALAKRYRSWIDAVKPGEKLGFALGTIRGPQGKTVPVLTLSKAKWKGLTNVLSQMPYDDGGKNSSTASTKPQGYALTAAGVLQVIDQEVTVSSDRKVVLGTLEKGFREYFRNLTGTGYTAKFRAPRDLREDEEVLAAADGDGGAPPDAEPPDSDDDAPLTPETSDDEDDAADPALGAILGRHTQDPDADGYDDLAVPEFRDETDENLEPVKAAREAGLDAQLYDAMRDEVKRLTAFLMQMKRAFGLTGGLDEAGVEKRILNWFKHLLKRQAAGESAKPAEAVIHDESCRFMLGLCRSENLRDFLGAESLLDADPAPSPAAKRREARAMRTVEDRLADSLYETALARAETLTPPYDTGSADRSKLEKIVAGNVQGKSGRERGNIIARLTVTMHEAFTHEKRLVDLLSLKRLPQGAA